VLYFSILARARGYTVAVLPDEKAGETPPDVRVTRGSESRLVKVEIGSRDKTTKWRNLQAAQGHAAICALDSACRERLASDCKLAKIPGTATDLLTLKAVRLHEATPDDPLWLEVWK
jgi:hypothetical protein